MCQVFKFVSLACAFVCLALPVQAAPKLDKETCDQLRTDQSKFIQTGILADIQRGPEWAKTNLAAERIREIELFITLDEQIKFGCRDVTLTGDALRAGEAAKRLELNPNLDPTQPPPPESLEPKSGDEAAKTENTGSGDAANAAPTAVGAPAAKAVVKPKTERRAQPAAKPKADDAYVPQPGTESTLDAPAVPDDPGDTAAP